jgi:hypothetical protein
LSTREYRGTTAGTVLKFMISTVAAGSSIDSETVRSVFRLEARPPSDVSVDGFVGQANRRATKVSATIMATVTVAAIIQCRFCDGVDMRNLFSAGSNAEQCKDPGKGSNDVDGAP